MDKTKKEETREEVTKPQFTHRYFCDGCTNVACFLDNNKPFPKGVTCQSCGKTASFKEENLIEI